MVEFDVQLSKGLVPVNFQFYHTAEGQSHAQHSFHNDDLQEHQSNILEA
ncbi:hypothetical protein FF38_07569 [Lucilia cuprina]|uniref:Uncharacterized protein n=1 Tax=Lucilia cuprina TaxID=7375 RepID=A0A0L0BZE1_LUCCU|nr:hypothetical protein FF38_07569 [Lucilia cuprina]